MQTTAHFELKVTRLKSISKNIGIDIGERAIGYFLQASSTS